MRMSVSVPLVTSRELSNLRDWTLMWRRACMCGEWDIIKQ